MKNFKKINKQEAKNLLDRALFKTFFHSLEWQDFLEKEFKWLRFEYYLYKNEFLLIFGKVGNKLISLPFCEYGGPLPLLARRSLGEGGKKNINFKQFKKDVLEEFKNVKIKIHPQLLFMWDTRYPTLSVGYRVSFISTHWLENLNKKTEADLLASFRKTLRHSIRKAQKYDLEIKKSQNLAELKQFYNLYVANLKRKKTVPYPFSVIRFLYNNSNSELLIAVYKNKIIAGDLFLYYERFVHYFLSASDYKYRNLGANYLILWEKIKRLAGKDIIFDFGAAPKGSALETFKRGWRGKEYPILQIGIKRTDESLRSSKIRNIFGLLPGFVIKILSSALIRYRL